MATWYVDSSASSTWAATTAYSLGDRVSGVTEEGVIFECTTAGTSGGSEPTWDTTPGNTTADSTATWTARNFDSWANASPRFYWTQIAVGGETIYVDHSHSESPTSSWTFDPAGDATDRLNPIHIITVDKDNSNALSTMVDGGGLMETVGGSTNIIFGGMLHIYGINLYAPDEIYASGIADAVVFENCRLKNGYRIRTGTERSYVSFRNCTFDCDDTAWTGLYSVNSRGIYAEFLNCDFNLSFTQTNSNALLYTVSQACILFEDCDLSKVSTKLYAAGTEGVSAANSSLTFRRCKLPTGYTVTRATGNQMTVSIEDSVSGTISAPTVGISERHYKCGVLTTETAVYRTDGAYDGEQANAVSWKIENSSDAVELYWAYKSPPIVRWCEAGSQTLTIYLAGGATMNDDDFWVEVSSPNETASPNQTAQGNFQSTRMTPLGTPAALTTDSSSTWNGSGVGTKQKIDVSINPTEPGPVTVRCFLAKPSTTVYVDPKIGVA